MIEGKVQDCGCVALPEELQAQTGLYPGATFELKVAEDGSQVILTAIQRKPHSEFNTGIACKA